MSSQQPAQSPVRAVTGLHARLGESGWTRTRAVLSLGMVLGLGAVGTMAAWTDQATATTGVFSTSSMQMKVDGQGASTAVTQLAAGDLMPRSSTAAMIDVSNTGTVPFTFTATATAQGDAQWAQSLTLEAFAGGTVDGDKCSGGTEIGSTTLAAGSENTLIGTGQALDAEAEQPVCLQVDVGDVVYKASGGKSAKAEIKFTAVESS